MDEVEEFCLRVLGDPGRASEAAASARAQAGSDRIATLAVAGSICRRRAEETDGANGAGDARGSDGGAVDVAPTGLAAAVALELAESTARLPERQREALALRELLRLSYDQMAQVMGIESSAVAPLLARARLRLRAERRGAGAPDGGCQDRDRALRVLACRQDSEPLSAEDSTWVLAHMAGCATCDTAHAAMLEASACYRAWPRG
jgi:DNA-directed RNA polymerase specialized sigma24 family protein